MHLRGEDMARPEDMISMRLWLTPDRVISTREADVDPILEIAARLAKGEGPVTSGDFLGDLVEEHLDEVEAQVEMIEDDTAQIAQLIGNLELEFACPNMADTETRISGFLRHLAPQRPVLATLSTLHHPVLDGRHRARLDDGLNRLLRLLETLQSLRDQIAILNDQVSRIQDRRLNRSSYVFAAAATIFLPLGFVTGMFGVNLMGLPLEDSPQGFWILTAICLGLSVGLLALFRWRKWL
jgi:zinc transporter